MAENKQRLGDLLVETNMLTEESLKYALKKKASNERLGDVLIRENLLSEQTLIEVLEFQLGIPHVNLSQFSIDMSVIKLVSKDIAKRYLLIPLRKDKNSLFVAMADPMDYFAIEELRMSTGFKIEPCIATKQELHKAISRYYDQQESVDAALSDLVAEGDGNDVDIVTEDSPIVLLVNQIINDAVAQEASDIHFDPQNNEFRIRFRIDGMLRVERILPKSMEKMIIARIKIMGHLNITENRLPQDGRVQINDKINMIDIRLSTLPTIFGEKVVMRILNTKNAKLGIEEIDLSSDNLKKFQQLIKRPNGILLITGPTGSGKSSTLSAALNAMNEESLNIITVEDPVEYQLDRVNQIQVREEIGLTFAVGLRAILRQDPDIVMVGEIRDPETAEIATRASLTGHLVLSTLHTNSAIESIARLKDMGIESYLITSSLAGIVAQRLVRRICKDCAKKRLITATEEIILQKNNLKAHYLVAGVGCPTCNNSGYKGRFAIQEVLVIDANLKQLILQEVGPSELLEQAQRDGFKTLMVDGLEKVLEGLTTVEEVVRVAIS